MKQLFHIEQAAGAETLQQVLSIRIGERHCGFAITDKGANQLFKLVYYSIDIDERNPVAVIFDQHPELNDSFYQVLVAYDHPQSTLVPWQIFKTDEGGSMLKALYGVNGSSTIVSESIGEWQLYNVYAVPKELHDWIGRKLATGKYWHQYSVGIKNINAAEAAGHLLVDLRNDDFTVMAAASGKLLIAQTFEYTTPEDILYYLLKTCQQFGLSQQEVQLSVSGLIDKQSSLYKELYQYFINISFREATWNITGAEFPAHFFTSLNDLARCAS